MKRILFIAVVFLSAYVCAQAKFTLSQCRSNAAMLKSPGMPLDFRTLSLEALIGREKELLFCEIDYPDVPDQQGWLNLDRNIWTQIADRQKHFLERHKMMDQFLEEDQNGER